MMCRVTDLRNKEVINLKNGERLGFVCDVELDITCGRVVAIVVPGRKRFPLVFWRTEEIIISWDDIDKIGEDYIFVCLDLYRNPRKRKNPLFSCFD